MGCESIFTGPLVCLRHVTQQRSASARLHILAIQGHFSEHLQVEQKETKQLEELYKNQTPYGSKQLILGAKLRFDLSRPQIFEAL